MKLKDFIKIKCLENDIRVESLAKEKLGFNSRQAMYHHLDRGNKEILKKIEKILNLKDGELSKFIQGDNL